MYASKKGRPVALAYKPARVKQRIPRENPPVGRAQDVVRDLWRTRQLGRRFLFHVDGKPLGQLKSEWRRAC
jgi:hypothetical protein